jgi:hypothetical protein
LHQHASAGVETTTNQNHFAYMVVSIRAEKSTQPYSTTKAYKLRRFKYVSEVSFDHARDGDRFIGVRQFQIYE